MKTKNALNVFLVFANSTEYVANKVIKTNAYTKQSQCSLSLYMRLLDGQQQTEEHKDIV